MNSEFRPNASFIAWGPFIGKDFTNQPVNVSDIVIASVIWFLTLVCVAIACWLAYRQTKSSRFPLRSVYVWLIWLELLASLLMGIECFLHLLKYIKPSFVFYLSILFWWCIQVQLLLQIIINRIRVIVPDRERSKWIMIGTAAIVTAINISVFNIWIPARLQVSNFYIHLNDIWDRIEKVIYLIIDALLNWYFLKTVKANLINNGLQKYNKLLKFNQRIIILSLLMDVMIIAAMSIPNSFVYIQFHPLAYLVKLNIEMTMANLIKRIAISSSRRTGNISIAQEFTSNSKSASDNTHTNTRGSVFELPSISHKKRNSKTNSMSPYGNQIKKTEEITVQSMPNPDWEDRIGEVRRGNENEIMVGGIVHERLGDKARSLETITDAHSSESVKDEGNSDVQRVASDSDDERLLEMRTPWKAGG
ncbi:hypothetical protein AOQ84DRAFT_387077 [Glonium stellatum]|uniref:Transmembrane protein n=1 Tax=Glonium stellatum TaxID=574774 RepID=A0A8E2F6B0_9PEZI|nr:hypothetical protein AOQ84DRAFT_387077 [Glonium stellatum]